ncbi:MAG: S-layer homology domain-containing protein [Clostridia bacterium]|nr:S-layer homology domain-containing protein [Clostridia bacterium]
MKKLFFVSMIVCVLLVSVCFAVTLTDIAGHWAEPYITELTNKGIINGYEDGTYRPEGEIKKGEYIKLIMVASLPEEDWQAPGYKYDHWASIYIQVAEREGIIDEGAITEANANDPITRGEMVEILGKCDIILRGTGQESTEMEFYDVSKLEAKQLAMLSHCVAKGLIAGYEDYTFRPLKTLTRAEVATILSRFLAK